MQPLRGSGQIYFTGGFSPDGQTFAAGGTGHVVELWNLADPSALARQIDTDGVAVTFANYTPAGDLVVARMRKAFLLVPPDGEVSSTWIEPLWVVRAALCADGTKLATAGDGAVVWEVGTEFRLLRDIPAGPGEFFTAVAISPDGRQFASARVLIEGETVIEVWDVTGDSSRLVAVEGTRVNQLAWSPDGRYLAGLVDMHLTVWATETWEEVFGPLPDQEHGTLLSVAFHPVSDQLLTGGADGVVSCWDMNSWHQLTSYRWDIGPIYCLAFAADGLRAAAAGHGAVILWDFDA